MNKVVVMALLLSGIALMHASEVSDREKKSDMSFIYPVKLRSAKKIRSGLVAAGHKHFIVRTKIDKTLGGKKLYIKKVIEVVERALDDFQRSPEDQMIIGVTTDSRGAIIANILQDHSKTYARFGEFWSLAALCYGVGPS